MRDIQEVIKETQNQLKEKYNYKNINQVPKIEKVILHRGLGEALTNSAVLEKTFELFYAISGQKPVFTKAKKSISNFKLREGQIVGCKVTLRSKKMNKGMDISKVVYLTEENVEKTPEGETLDEIGLNKMCCRRHMLTHVDIE